jgi:hypothetical protein
VDVVDVEALDDLVDREDLFLGARRPAEQREVVDERLADEALLDVVGHRRLALALAHLGAIRVEDEGQVREPRDIVAKGPEQEDVLRRVGEVVLATDHVRDLHRRVVDDDREVVERRAVVPNDHEVATQVRDVDLDPASNDVVERDHPLADAEPEGAAAPLGLESGAFFRREARTAARIARWQLRGFLAGPLLGQLLGAAVARVRLVLGAQRRGGPRVQRQALHLAVRAVRSACGVPGHLGALVPGQAEPVQPIEDVLLVRDR